MSLAGVNRAVRRFCLDCQGGSAASVVSCLDAECLFYPERDAKSEPEGDEGCLKAGAVIESDTGPGPRAVRASSTPRRPLRLIRGYCLGCAGSRREVRECEAKDDCPLWSYRFGVKPSTFKRVSSRLKKERQSLKLPGL